MNEIYKYTMSITRQNCILITVLTLGVTVALTDICKLKKKVGKLEKELSVLSKEKED